MKRPPIWLCVLVLLMPSGFSAQPPVESSMGTYPLPEIVGMTDECPGVIVASGVLNAKADELDQGTVAIGPAMLMLHPAGVPWQMVKGRLGEAGDLVWKPKCNRAVQEIKR